MTYKPRPASQVKYIVVHCAATQPTADIGWKDIDRWHRAKGWLMGGYNWVIRRDGTVEAGRPLDMVGAHVEGHNEASIGICLAGGINKAGKAENNFTEEQFTALRDLLGDMFALFPGSTLMGHRDFPGVKKECPSFNVRSWYEGTY